MLLSIVHTFKEFAGASGTAAGANSADADYDDVSMEKEEEGWEFEKRGKLFHVRSATRYAPSLYFKGRAPFGHPHISRF